MNLHWPAENYWTEHPDTIAQLQRVYDYLPQILASTDRYDKGYTPELDFNNFNQRFRDRDIRSEYAGVQYIGHLDQRKLQKNKKYYNIIFRTAGSQGKQYYCNLEDLSGENEEVKAFAGYQRRIHAGHFKRLRKKVSGSKFADVRVRVKGKSGRLFVIQLKHGDQLISLNVYLHHPQSGSPNAKTTAALYEKYRQQLRILAKAFDAQIAANLEKANLFWPCIKLLLPKEIDNDSLKLQAIQTALTAEAGARTYNLWSPTSNRKSSRWAYYNFPGYAFMRTSGKAILEDITTNTTPDWRQLLDNYEPEVMAPRSALLRCRKRLMTPSGSIHIRLMRQAIRLQVHPAVLKIQKGIETFQQLVAQDVGFKPGRIGRIQ